MYPFGIRQEILLTDDQNVPFSSVCVVQNSVNCLDDESPVA